MAKKLKLLAIEPSEIEIVSAACQDALFLPKDAVFNKKARRFAISVNRFKWESASANKGDRVAALLSFESILGVSAKGVNPKSNIPLSILSIEFNADSEPPSGEFALNLAQGAQIKIKAECIDILLGDIGETRQAKQTPEHEL